MPGVTVKGVNQWESGALPAFLKRSRKLNGPEWVDPVKLAKHTKPTPCDENWVFCSTAAGPPGPRWGPLHH
uniref:Uncharacterized protein n=2 Tax=Sus scrofa TaxID=9823 RepID=A0A8W4FDS3_PIG